MLERAGGVERNADRIEALMAPTRIYVADVLALLDDFDIRGMAHITGGGLDENIVRVIPDGFGVDIDADAWRPPEIFSWLAEVGRIEAAEMRRTFNLGIGFVLVAPEADADGLAERIAESGASRPPVIGRIRRVGAGGPRVRFGDG